MSSERLVDHSDDDPTRRSMVTALERSRAELLDLGLRNNLLNYRKLKARGVEINEDTSERVFSLLVTEDETLTFRPLTESSRQRVRPGNVRKELRRRVTSGKTLQVDCEAEELFKRLLNTHDSARTAIEEQGVNTLFLGLGMLNWFESAQSSTRRFAPLVLVPVELRRREGKDDFTLKFTGEEIGSNLSLEAKLKDEFNIESPSFDAEQEQISNYFEAFDRKIAERDRWTLDRDRIVLGQFSFNKFLMYHDLDPDEWPESDSPLEHPILQALLSRDGFPSQPPLYRDDQFLDEAVDLDRQKLVIDADSSQTLALLDVLDGRTMVVQGPPGTGKSQTITNLVALAIDHNKTVLFVAEKMAALEVVKRRLDELGLGAACLELHGTKTRKRRVLDDIQRTLDGSLAYGPSDTDEADRLRSIRSWFNIYSSAINSPIEDSGITVYDAIGELLQMRDEYDVESWPDLSLDDAVEWNPETARELQSLVEELQGLIRQIGDPSKNLFRGVMRAELGPADQDRLRRLLNRCISLLESVIDKNGAIWTQLDVNPKETQPAVETAIETARRAADVSFAGTVRFSDERWDSQSGEIGTLLSDGARHELLINTHQKFLSENATPEAISDLLANLGPLRGSWLRWLSPGFWSNRDKIRELLTDDAPDSAGGRIEILESMNEAYELRKSLLERDSLGREMYLNHWRGLDSNLSELEQAFEIVSSVREDVEEVGLSSALLKYLERERDPKPLANLGEQLQAAVAALDQNIEELLELLDYDESLGDSHLNAIRAVGLRERLHLIRTWQSRQEDIVRWIEFQGALRRCRQRGISEVADLALEWNESGRSLGQFFRYHLYLSLLNHAWDTHPVLSDPSRRDKSEYRQEFATLDVQQLARNRGLLAYQHWSRLPRDGGGELTLLLREIQKKRRNLPIRKLIDDAGRAIQAIKPVFLMSPLSVANFIPPGSIEFDLIVFDEASQVMPVDAFGAILRGKQTIVVGDDRQLPPTTFFEKFATGNEEIEDLEDSNHPGDLQSVLNLFLAQNAPNRMLRWHYRSRHHSLIAVSNQEFYENRLVIFPSPDNESEVLGLRFHHLPGTVYDRGRSRTNREEAAIVARHVQQHAHKFPDKTLGVAAFSSAQSLAIRDQLEILRRDDPALEEFLASHETEPFFVKNLEHVQGDERDVILISVGYGRDEERRMTMNFGPLNSDGGERRLNVLITRARLRCEIFSNFTDEDIPPNVASRGVRALKSYLHYARTGEIEPETSVRPETQSPFEEVVRRRLEAEGYQVRCQVGSAGYFIDLAVVDNDRPGRYLLGIECDGASYHSARSSRDRDRLRQQVLEGLGWRIHRIWSTDWFASPGKEFDRALQAIDHARERKDTDLEWTSGSRSYGPFTNPIDPKPTVVPLLPPSSAPGYPEYQIAGVKLPPGEVGLRNISDEELQRAILQVVQVESPIHQNVLARRLANAASLARTGQRIQNRIDQLVAELAKRGALTLLTDFIWKPSQSSVVPRNRAELSTQDRKVELIAPEEIDAAIVDVVGRSFSISIEETTSLAAQIFGIQRTGTHVRSRMLERIKRLIERGILVRKNDLLVVRRREEPSEVAAGN